MRALSVRLLTLSILAGASAARAHDFWLEPSSSVPAAGDAVAIRIRVGERLVGDAVPRNPLAIVRFEAVDPQGKVAPAPGAPGVDPAALVTPAAPGLHWIVYQSKRSGLELAPTKFAEYLKLEGLEQILEERARRGESEVVAREAFSRSAKSALCVPGGSGGALAPQGLTLELIAESDPCAQHAGGELRFRLFFRDQPVKGVLVQALRRETAGAPAGPPVARRTDSRGRVTLPLDRPGFWLIKAVVMERAAQLPDIEWESFWASLTFELAAAP